MGWALETTKNQCQADPSHAKLVHESMQPLMEAGFAGPAKAAVLTQANVLKELGPCVDHQKQLLSEMNAHASELGRKCVEQSEYLAKELNTFCAKVLENTADITGMLESMRDGLQSFQLLKEEASRD